MGSICLHSIQVTAKNSIKIKSFCFGTATEAVAAVGDEATNGVSICSSSVLTGVTIEIDGEHAVPKMMSITAKGRIFRNMDRANKK